MKTLTKQGNSTMRTRTLGVAIICGLLAGCTSSGDNYTHVCSTDSTPDRSWQILSMCRTEGQLLGVWAEHQNNVWAVGADGQVLHFHDCAWETLDVGTTENLWWVFGLPEGPTYISGDAGTLLKIDRDGSIQQMDTGVDVTLFGVWGTAPDDLWTVGFVADDSKPAVLLHFDGNAWTPPTELPTELGDNPHFFKVWGTATDDVWVVGSNDLIMHWDGESWEMRQSGLNEDWVTVTGTGTGTESEVYVVGGRGEGKILSRREDAWESVAPEAYPSLQGVCTGPNNEAIATGLGATILSKVETEDGGAIWDQPAEVLTEIYEWGNPPRPECTKGFPDYHACVSDGAGGFFLVGGNFFGPLTEGIIVYYGPPIPTTGL